MIYLYVLEWLGKIRGEELLDLHGIFVCGFFAIYEIV